MRSGAFRRIRSSPPRRVARADRPAMVVAAPTVRPKWPRQKALIRRVKHKEGRSAPILRRGLSIMTVAAGALGASDLLQRLPWALQKLRVPRPCPRLADISRAN